jgi:predicted nucleic acid-binding protein
MKKQNRSVELIYLDTSVFVGKILSQDNEDKKSKLLLNRIFNHKYDDLKFVSSKFTLIELAELISRKKTKNKAKIVLFDLMYNPDIPIYFINPEKEHKEWKKKEYFDIDRLISNFINTALDFNIPGFDTIHAHTVKKLNEKMIAVSKDNHFKRFKQLKNIIQILKPSEFIEKY